MAGIPKPSPELAHEFSRFIDYSNIKLSVYDHFPMEKGLLGIANLDLSTAFSSMCRWHRYVIDYTDYILPLLNLLLEQERIKPEIIYSLLTLYGHYSSNYFANIVILPKLVAQYYRLGDNDAMNSFVSQITHDFKKLSAKKEAKDFYELVKNGRFLNKNVLKELQEYVGFTDTLVEENEVTSYRNHPYPQKTKNTSVDFSSIKITSSSYLIETIKNLNQGEEWTSISQINDFFRSLKNGCQPSDYATHLSALIKIPTSLVSWYSIETALESRFKDWSSHPAVEQWKKDNLKSILIKWLEEFAKESHLIDIPAILNITELFSATKEDLARVVTEILPKNIELLSASSIYQIVELLQTKVTKEENQKIISWVLKEWNTNIKDDFGDGIWNSTSPTDLNQVIAMTFRHILGDPDKRNRWKAIHSLRRLVNTGNTEILRILLEKQNDKSCFPFQNEKHTFYWISAKLYLWCAIERISKDIPDVLLSFKDDFYTQLISNELPHILIKFFIRISCLNLHEYDPTAYSEKEYKVVAEFLRPKLLCTKRPESSIARGKYPNYTKKWRFEFDTLDTLPYAYRRLANKFNLLEEDVADIADKFITEKWGYVGKHREDNHVKADWLSTSNRKGGRPEVEDLKNYYENHAMFCAAFELLKNKPLHDYPDGWVSDSWKYWLESNAITWKNYWQSELTTHLPFDRKFWISDYHKFDKKWKENIEDEIYDIALGLKNNCSGFLTLRGEYTMYFSENYESISMQSSLVSTNTSEALLRGLQSLDDQYSYDLPDEGDNYEHHDLNFKLLGWLKYEQTEYHGLDSDDYLLNENAKNLITLGELVFKTMNLEKSSDFLENYYQNEQVSKYFAWDHTYKNNRIQSQFETRGSFIQVQVRFLLDFLTKIDMSLIVKCVVNRQLKKPDYSKNRNRVDKNVKLYLIHHDGTVKTLRGNNYQIGQKNSPRTKT